MPRKPRGGKNAATVIGKRANRDARWFTKDETSLPRFVIELATEAAVALEMTKRPYPDSSIANRPYPGSSFASLHHGRGVFAWQRRGSE